MVNICTTCSKELKVTDVIRVSYGSQNNGIHFLEHLELTRFCNGDRFYFLVGWNGIKFLNTNQKHTRLLRVKRSLNRFCRDIYILCCGIKQPGSCVSLGLRRRVSELHVL